MDLPLFCCAFFFVEVNESFHVFFVVVYSQRQYCVPSLPVLFRLWQMLRADVLGKGVASSGVKGAPFVADEDYRALDRLKVTGRG